MKQCLSKEGAVSHEGKSNTQREKMKDCNHEAAGKKGDERKAFMKECLSKEGVTPRATPHKSANQREKMKTCNQQAGDKKGDERKAFMRECLKKDN
ncbi:MAG: PsiF family protein [Burkholderiales bacterium]|nr:PsiF family protein [Burkholderiales bacterium]